MVPFMLWITPCNVSRVLLSQEPETERPPLLAPSGRWFGRYWNLWASEKRSREHESHDNLEHRLAWHVAAFSALRAGVLETGQASSASGDASWTGRTTVSGILQSVLVSRSSVGHPMIQMFSEGKDAWSWKGLQASPKQGKLIVLSMRAMQSNGSQVLDMSLTDSVTRM